MAYYMFWVRSYLPETFLTARYRSSLSLAVSIHWFTQSYCEAINAITTMLRLLLLYQFWLAKICICHKPRPFRAKTRDLQIALPRTLMLPFFFFLYFWYSTCKTHLRLFRTLRLAILLITSCFFLLVLLWKEFNSHNFVVTFHFSCSFSSPPVFLSSQGRLLDSRKRWLFCLHIQYNTCCLFEWWTSVGSSEAVCGVCLLISPPHLMIWWSRRWQPEVGFLLLVLLRGNGISSSDDLSAGVSSVAYVLFNL